MFVVNCLCLVIVGIVTYLCFVIVYIVTYLRFVIAGSVCTSIPHAVYIDITGYLGRIDVALEVDIVLTAVNP